MKLKNNNPLSVVEDPSLFIEIFWRKRALKLTSGCVLSPFSDMTPDLKGLGSRLTIQTVLNAVWLDYSSQVRDLRSDRQPVRPVSKDLIHAAFENFLVRERQKVITDYYSEVAHRPDADPEFKEIRQFVRALTGKESDLDAQVMRHFIWQVKRKLSGKPVVHHMMPVFYGAQQGSGKSTAVKLLTGPLKELVTSRSVADLNDSFAFKSLSESFVVVFEELSGGKRTEIETLKRVITEDVVSARIMFSQQMQNLPQNATFIGTSNKSIDQVFYDSSGMRRFYQIEAQGRVDWKAINGIDYTKLWQSVDENAACVYSDEDLEQLANVQSKFIRKSPVAEFLSESNLSPGNGERIPKQKLYLDFKLYLEESGFRRMSIQDFSNELRNLGFTEGRDKTGRFWNTSAPSSTDAKNELPEKLLKFRAK